MNAARRHWHPAYIGIGSNLDDPRSHVLRAFSDIAALEGVRLEARSSLYRSPPMGPGNQPDYVNAVAATLTVLPAPDLLAALQGVEAAHGRIRGGERWGPRPLDLDLLVYGDDRIDLPHLRVPHPGVGQRNFVLLPLAEVAPWLDIPGLGNVASLAARAADNAAALTILAS